MNNRLGKAAGLALFLFLTVGPGSARAQEGDWNAEVHAPPGYDLTLEDLWYVTITNRVDMPVEVTLFGEVFEMSRGPMFHGRSNPLMIPPGGMVITPNHVTAINDDWFNPEFREAIDRTSRFPAGEYEIFVTVCMADNNQGIVAGSTRVFVTLPSAPRLISPVDESEMVENAPVFQWTEPIPLPPNAEVFYRFRICEIQEGQSVSDAIENIPHYEEEHTFMTSLLYPVDAQDLVRGKSYVWQVQALDGHGTPVGENEGKSEIFVFRFREESKEATPLPFMLQGIVVNTTVDSVYGWMQNKSKPCSFREALRAANDKTGPDTVLFAMSLSDPNYDAGRGVWVFRFFKELPSITDDGTVIDGSLLQNSGSFSSLPQFGVCQKPIIELDGTGLKNGLVVKGDDVSINGLAIVGFSAQGISLEGTDGVLTCNAIGTDADNASNKGNGNGIVVHSAASKIRPRHTIGKSGAGNLISGNTKNGILVSGSKSGSNTVEGNVIGLKSDGKNALANSTGILIESGSNGNRIGRSTPSSSGSGSPPLSGNLIAGNQNDGLRIVESDSTVVVNNWIGISANREAAGNGQDGIVLSGACRTSIGGQRLGNVIGGNRNGIFLKSETRKSADNTIDGNSIGTNSEGTSAVPNLHRGVHLKGSSHHNTIGGTYGNVISGNKDAGILIEENSHSNNVSKNRIGIGNNDASLPNNEGVVIQGGAQYNWIGGEPAKANEIAYNTGDGVHVIGSTTLNNGIASNSIHHNGGKGIDLGSGAHGEQLRIWETISLGGKDYYVIGEVDSAFYRWRVAAYSDEGDEGHSCENPIVIPDTMRVGWFGFKATKTYTNFTFTVSDSMGLNTSEFLRPAAPAKVGTWKWDMDYYETDPDNGIPLNPHYHGGWGNWPPVTALENAFHSNFKKGDISNVAHNMFFTDGSLCNFFANYNPLVRFTGDLYWETFYGSDDDYNMGLWTPAGTGVCIYTQRYFKPSKNVSRTDPKKVTGFDTDPEETANNQGQNAAYSYLVKKVTQEGERPILTLEFDSDETIDNYSDHHPWWKQFRAAVDKDQDNGTYARDMVNGKKAIVLGYWCFDCQHKCRSEVHPVLGMAIQTQAPAADGSGREVWDFYMRNKGNQGFCGEVIKLVSSIPDWCFRFPGQSGRTPKNFYGTNGYCHEENDDTVSWSVYPSGDDIVVKIHIPDEDDWLIGSVIIDW